MDVDHTTDLHVGPKSTDFNTHLRIGTCIGPSGGEGSGTLGGFVVLKDGGIGALTCAHVTQGRKLISQPADAELENSSLSRRCVFGQVCEEIFTPGSPEEVGVDAAVIIVMDRLPNSSQILWTQTEQLAFAGLDPNSKLEFTKGKILSRQELTPSKRHSSLIKSGAKTGLTCGKLYCDGLYARILNKDIKLPYSSKIAQFFNQMEVNSIRGSSRFFDIGDSGSLVFICLDGSELHCIGLCVGYTSYGSCIVTPIEEVFNKSDKASRFIDFTQL